MKKKYFKGFNQSDQERLERVYSSWIALNHKEKDKLFRFVIEFLRTKDIERFVFKCRGQKDILEALLGIIDLLCDKQQYKIEKQIH